MYTNGEFLEIFLNISHEDDTLAGHGVEPYELEVEFIQTGTSVTQHSKHGRESTPMGKPSLTLTTATKPR